MKKNKVTNVCSIIMFSVIIILVAFIVLKYVHNDNVPNFVFILLGLSLVLSPLIYYLSTTSAAKKNQSESNTIMKKKKIPIIVYYLMLVVALVFVFICDRNFFVPLLLCQLPVIGFFTFAIFKS